MTTETQSKAQELMRLHTDSALLPVVNVWDVSSTKVVADVEGTKAIATASKAIASSFGYEDGEKIPLDLHLDHVARIVEATDLPVTADLEGGYGDAAETVRRAIGIGVVGANIEDQLRPLPEAAAQVEAIVRVAEQEGVEFVLNARTDAFALRRGGDPEESMRDALERGRAFLDAGAPVVFVPAFLDEKQISRLADEFGPQRLSVLGIPGMPTLGQMEDLGVARVSYGPMPHSVALTALQDMAMDVVKGGGVPEGFRLLS